ncbi:MAG: M23 family metallopeptidase [Acidimicrobiales bacterium]
MAAVTISPPVDAAVPAAARCPVAGQADFGDTFGAPRSGGRTHEGVDMFAERGTPVVAVVDGLAVPASNPLGGLTVNLYASGSQDFYYYAHNDRNAFSSQRQVRAGDVLGYVGTSGNASGTPPHLHFEIHPGGGAAKNPTPDVTRWCTPTTGRGQDTIGVVNVSADGAFKSWHPSNDNVYPAGAGLFGRPNDTVVTGDWDGDGDDTYGVVVRQSDGTLMWHLSNDNVRTAVSRGYGRTGDVPVTGDWDGDGDDNIGVVNSTPDGKKAWHLDHMNGVYRHPVFGRPGDVAMTGDWDGR